MLPLTFPYEKQLEKIWGTVSFAELEVSLAWRPWRGSVDNPVVEHLACSSPEAQSSSGGVVPPSPLCVDKFVTLICPCGSWECEVQLLD